jgi:4a-hydroxytetrahydrobiopterin dehydratase
MVILMEKTSFSHGKKRCTRKKEEIMGALNQEKCTACRADAPQVTESEIPELSLQIPQWTVLREGILKLQRVFRFKNFAEAMAFTVQVGALAESANHHPAILTEWGKVTVTYWTHAIRGLHRNDFVMAARTDDLFTAPAAA